MGIPGWPQFESGLTAGWLAQAGSHSARYSEHQNTEDYGLHIFTLQFLFREGLQKKNRFFLGNSPKQRTPPTHPYGLGLT